MVRINYVVIIDFRKAIRFKDPRNRKSLIFIETINSVGRSILPILIFIKINFLTLFFFNDFNNEILVITADIGYSNN